MGACPVGGAQCNCPNGTPLKGPECNEHDTPGCKSCDDGFKMNDDGTACEAKCVTNDPAVSGGKNEGGTNAGTPMPEGTRCTGWYSGVYYAPCEDSGYGGYGWCGVEAKPGEDGPYQAADKAWGG